MNIVITGASSGIGRALYDAFSGEHKVFGCSRHPLQGQDYCDVAQEILVQRFAKNVGGSVKHVDALILCAGVFGAIGTVAETHSDAWRRAIEVNLFGSYYAIKAFSEILSPEARIITFAGGGAFRAFPQYSAYACSKAAIVRLTECLSEESRRTVVAVAPGFLPTGIHEATLKAGPHRAGEQYQKTAEVMLGKGEAKMENVINLVRKLIDPKTKPHSGRAYCAQPQKERIPVHG